MTEEKKASPEDLATWLRKAGKQGHFYISKVNNILYFYNFG